MPYQNNYGVNPDFIFKFCLNQAKLNLPQKPTFKNGPYESLDQFDWTDDFHADLTRSPFLKVGLQSKFALSFTFF